MKYGILVVEPAPSYLFALELETHELLLEHEYRSFVYQCTLVVRLTVEINM